MTLELPPELEPYCAQIEATVRPCVVLEKADGEPGLRDSKVGGVAYWPKGMDYPTDSSGRPMYMLMQLNLGDLPKLEGYPKAGILQFFIVIDPYYGSCNVDETLGEGHRVIYHANVLKSDESLVSIHIVLGPGDQLPLNILNLSITTKLKGTSESMVVTSSDASYYPIFSNIDEFDNNVIMEKFREPLLDVDWSTHLGGYPQFFQGGFSDEDSEWLTLLTITADEKINILYGQGGVGNFFILPQDLANLDFSRVLYAWDM